MSLYLKLLASIITSHYEILLNDYAKAVMPSDAPTFIQKSYVWMTYVYVIYRFFPFLHKIKY